MSLKSIEPLSALSTYQHNVAKVIHYNECCLFSSCGLIVPLLIFSGVSTLLQKYAEVTYISQSSS